MPPIRSRESTTGTRETRALATNTAEEGQKISVNDGDGDTAPASAAPNDDNDDPLHLLMMYVSYDRSTSARVPKRGQSSMI